MTARGSGTVSTDSGSTHIERFGEFTAAVSGRSVPDGVIHEASRIILDSIGCALAAGDTPSGRAGIDYGRILGGVGGAVTMIGTSDPTSAHGAAFANAELTQALDFDAVAAPGHVAPYAVPVALALGERARRSGAQVATAVAVAHEISCRFSQAMDRNRDVKDGRATTAPVLGYSSTIFGVTAAAAMMLELSGDSTMDALGIAGSTSPVNAHRAWLMHAPATTIKNSLMPGGVALNAMTAAFMAQLGHRGDRQLLDDPEFGYPRFIGTTRWEPAELTTGLGEEWRFPASSFFKPYPHCRVSHALFDALVDIVETHRIDPGEIDQLRAWGEEWVGQFPTFLNRNIERPFDAQFSFAHGLALAAHTITPGKAWQDPEVVYSDSVLALMERVVWKPHPEWAAAVSRDPAARPSRVEIDARGTTYVGERSYPKGSPSPDPSTRMTDAEIVDKFCHNADGVLAASVAREVADRCLGLAMEPDAAEVLRLLRPAAR